MSIVNGLGFYESINKLIIGFLLLFLFVKPDFESSLGGIIFDTCIYYWLYLSSYHTLNDQIMA